MSENKAFLYGIGNRLRVLREAKHLSQADVAKQLSMAPASISAYENESKTPSLEVFAELIAFYDASADYLIGFHPKESLLKGLNEEQVDILYRLVHHFKKENEQ